VAEPAPGSRLYADYIAEQLAREDERKASLESRGVIVVTTSGTLATLLLGFATLTKRSHGQFVLPHPSHEWVKWALVLFTSSAVAAIVTNAPFRYHAADVGGLRGLLKDSWNDNYEVAEKEVAENRLDVLGSAKRWNSIKGWMLFLAVICEVLAVTAITRAVWLAL